MLNKRDFLARRVRELVAAGALIFGLCVTQAPSAFAQGAASSEAAQAQFKAAAGLQNKGVFDLAADEWATFLKKYPDDPNALKAKHYRGVCLLQLKKYDEARQLFEEVLQKKADFEFGELTLFNLALVNTGLNKSAAAVENYGQLLTKYPNGRQVSQALYNRGEILYNDGKTEEALRDWLKLLERKPEGDLKSETMYSAGVALLQVKKYDEAAKLLDAFLKEYPQHAQVAEVTLYRGEAAMALGKTAEAGKLFAAAAAAKNFNLADQALMRQADVLSADKKLEEAAALYASLSTKFPKSEFATKAALYAGNHYYLLGKTKEAQTWLDKAVAAGREESAEAAHWLTRLALKEGKADDAWKAAAKGIALGDKSSHYVELLLDQADVALELPAHAAEAADMYANIAALYPKHAQAPQALYLAAFAALQREQFDTALKHAQAFAKSYPQDKLTPDVQQIAAEAQLLLKQYEQADKLYKELLAKHGQHNDAELWSVRRGLALQMQKKNDEVVKYFKGVIPGLKNADQKAEAQYVLGTAQLDLKQFPDAVKSFEAALSAAPKSKLAEKYLLALGQAQRSAGDATAATATMNRLLKEFPNSKLLDQAHFRLAEYAYAKQDWKTAAAEYGIVLKDAPTGPFAANALFGLGWTQISQQDYAAAAKSFSGLIEKHADHPLAVRGRYGRAVARQQLKEFSPAIEDLQYFLKSDLTTEEKSDAQYIQGLCQIGLNQVSEGVKSFETLLKNDPKYPGADKVLYELAWAQKGDKQEKGAADAFVRLAKDYPNSPLVAEAQYHVGEYYYHDQKDYPKAADAYFAAFNKAGATDLAEKAGHKLGWAYYQQGEFDRAQQTFASQLKNRPQGELAADAQFMVGECLFKLNKFAEALAGYELALKQKPSSKEFETLSLLHAGQAASQLKTWDKALTYLDRCAKDFPESAYLPEVQYEQGWIKKSQNQLDDAEKLFTAAAEGAPNRLAGVRAHFMLGEIHFQRKAYGKAVGEYFKVSVNAPNGPEFVPWKAHATYEAAVCLEALEKKSEAKKLYEELLRDYPKSEHVAGAKKRLAALGK